MSRCCVIFLQESFYCFVQNIGKFVQSLKCFVQKENHFSWPFSEEVRAFKKNVGFLTEKVSGFSSKMLNFNDLIVRAYEEAVLFMLFDSRFRWSASVGNFLFGR